MAERGNSVRGRVIRKWKKRKKKGKKKGKQDWSLEKTLMVCIKTDSELEKDGLKPAQEFRNHRKYLVNWVQGCHFPWLNPR